MHVEQAKPLDTLQGSIALCLIRAATKNNGVTTILKKINKKLKSKQINFHVHCQGSTMRFLLGSYSHVGWRKG